MKLSTPRYSCCLFFQLAFILCDLIFNCVSLFPRSRDGLLVLFIFQDLFLVLSITSMLMSLFSTYLFQAGLVEAVVRKFRALAGAGAAYVLSALALHAAALLSHPAEPTEHPTVHPAPTSPTLLFLYTLHRCLAPWFYWVYKRAALQASDPRLHEDVDWLSRQQHTRNGVGGRRATRALTPSRSARVARPRRTQPPDDPGYSHGSERDRSDYRYNWLE